MPIPHDPEKRWWVEAAGTKPDLVDSLRPALVAFLGFDSDRIPQLVGTGFIVAAESELALVVSAKHVLVEGVLRTQRPVSGHTASALVLPRRDRIPSIEPERLKVVWMGSTSATMLDAIHVSYNESLDIAGCLLLTQEGESISQRTSIPLDTNEPSVGDVVHMVSMEGMEVEELVPPKERNGKGQMMSVFRRISIRVGVVTAVYPKGWRQFRWPCFTTSIPAKPGMSGGFVYFPRDGITIAACGVVCADNSTDGAHRDYSHCGESVIATAWPALSLRVPFTVSCPPSGSTCTLFEMIRLGRIPQPIGGIDGITVVETGGGDCTIGKSPPRDTG